LSPTSGCFDSEALGFVCNSLDTVSKTSRHHKRGGKSKNKIKVKDKSQPLKINFLNIRGITSKLFDHKEIYIYIYQPRIGYTLFYGKAS
jgi:hypothetical protein